MTDKPTYALSVISDILSAMQIPGTSTLATAIQHMLKKRMERARDVLIEEMKLGDKTTSDAAEIDEIASILYRYGRAAQEGAARINLRILAQIIASQHRGGVLKADEFLYLADIIAGLRMEEIILLASLQKNMKLRLAGGDRDSTKAAWMALTDTQEELFPAVFSTKEDFKACCASLLRTGFLVPEAGIGGIIYLGTDLLDKVIKMAQLEDALAKERLARVSPQTAKSA